MTLLKQDFDTARSLLDVEQPARLLLVNYGLDRCAIWIVSIAVMLGIYRTSDSLAAVAVVLLVYIAARALFAALTPAGYPAGNTQLRLVLIARLVSIATLATVVLLDSYWWSLIPLATFAGATGVMDKGYHRLLPLAGRRADVPRVNRLVGWLERLAAFLGPFTAGLLLLLLDEGVTAGIASAMLVIATLIYSLKMSDMVERSSGTSVGRVIPAGARRRFALHQTLRHVAVGLLCMAAIGVLVRVVLVEVAFDRFEYAGGYYGLLVCLIGIGALLGPVPVDRLLGHFSAELLLTGGVISLAIGAIIIGAGGHPVVLVPVLLASGLVVVTLDLVSAVTLRRVVPEDDLTVADNVLFRAVLSGQLAALGIVVVLTELWGIGGAVGVVGAVSVVVMLWMFIANGGVRLLLQMAASTREKADTRREA